MLRLGFGVMVMLVISSIAYASTTNSGLNTVKLKPKIRESRTIKPVTTISMETLRPFIRTSLILDDKKQFLNAPYVLAENENRIEGGPRSVLYVRGVPCPSEESAYDIYREGQIYKHPCTGEKLGFEAINIGTAELKTPGDPAVFTVVSVTEAVEVGTRLLPSFASPLPNSLTIRPANLMEEGFILSVRDGLNQIGRNQVVLISLGQRDGLVEGNTLDIMQKGRKVVDPKSKGWRKKLVQLPHTRIGSVLVFQTYEKLSLGLVLEATEIINVLDKVKSP